MGQRYVSHTARLCETTTSASLGLTDCPQVDTVGVRYKPVIFAGSVSSFTQCV